VALSRRVNSAAAAESGALDNKQIHSKRHPLGCAFCGLVPAMQRARVIYDHTVSLCRSSHLVQLVFLNSGSRAAAAALSQTAARTWA